MTNEQFCYWLRGFVEINEEIPNRKQWQSIKEHLQTVFIEVTSNPFISRTDPNKYYCK